MLCVEIKIIKDENDDKICSPIVLVSQDGLDELVPIALPPKIRVEEGVKLSGYIEQIILKSYNTLDEVKRDYYKN